MDAIKVSVVSMSSGEDKVQNLSDAGLHIAKAVREGAKWIVLPELFNYYGSYDRLGEMAEGEKGPTLKALKDIAKSNRVHLFSGTIAETDCAQLNPKIYNTMFVISPKGHVIAKYRKTHLFNLQASEGVAAYRESDGFAAGSCFADQLILDGFNVGLAICYDIRFPEMFIKISKNNPVDVLIVASAFTKATGEAHWELLLRARAVEHQCYVVAANQTGFHGAGKHSFGHSMIISPWGEVLADTGVLQGIATAMISKSELLSVRSRLPALENKRRDLYQ